MDKNRLIAIGIAVAVLAPLITFVVMPVARGSTKLLTVLGGSMSPAMGPGDVAVVTQIDPSELRVGDIVAYRKADDPNNIISHRVIEVINDGELSFRTRGDANEDPDFSLVGSSDVVGKVTFVVPKVGYIFNFAKTPIGFSILVVAPAVLLIVIEIRKIAGYVRRVESNRGKRQSRGKRRTVKMRRYERIATICMMSVLTMSSITPSLVAYTNGYLSDSATSANNVIAAGIWTIPGEIIDFIVPGSVTLGEVAEFTVLFKNTGDVSLAVRAFVEVRKGKEGTIEATENGALAEVGVGGTISLKVQWDTSGANQGNYWAVAWVCFDSASTSTTEPERFEVKKEGKPSGG